MVLARPVRKSKVFSIAALFPRLSAMESGTARATFKYSPLPTPGSIRLITLLPGPQDAPLSCCISLTDIGSPETYEALSYEWGPEAELFPLYCCCEDHSLTNSHNAGTEMPSVDYSDGFACMAIRINLREALLRLRYGDKARRLWIDAVCINQEDNAEKSVQVGQMKDIYSQASLVIAWLGKDDGQTGEVMDAACVIHRYYLQQALSEREPRLLREDEFSCRNRTSYKKAPKTKPTEKAWEGAGKLLLRSYFTRLWIVQELVVAHRAQVICGAFLIDYRCLRDLMVAAYEYTKSLQGSNWVFWNRYLNGDATAVLSLQYNMRSGWSDKVEPEDLAWLLWRTRSLKCADPRDKVFALLNISSKDPRTTLHANYDTDLSSVYVAAARIALESTSSELDMCLNLFEQITVEKSTSLPSWVPDWRINDSYEIRLRGGRRFDAHGLGKYYSRENFIDFEPPTCLRLRGVKVTEVLTIAAEDTADETQNELDLSESFQLASTIPVDGKYPSTRHHIREAFFRTRLADSVVRDDNEGHELNFSFVEDGSLVRQDESGLSFVVIEPTIISDIQLRSTAHRFFVSNNNMMGLCPVTALPGDVIYIIIGCGTPLLLRPTQNRLAFHLVGVCYVHGYMDGEWIRELAIDAKSRDQEAEDMDFDAFLIQWREDDQVLQWTEGITLV